MLLTSRDPVLFAIGSPIAVTGALTAKLEEFSAATRARFFPTAEVALARQYLESERVALYMAELLDPDTINELMDPDAWRIESVVLYTYSLSGVLADSNPVERPTYGYSFVLEGDESKQVDVPDGGDEVTEDGSSTIFGHATGDEPYNYVGVTVDGPQTVVRTVTGATGEDRGEVESTTYNTSTDQDDLADALAEEEDPLGTYFIVRGFRATFVNVAEGAGSTPETVVARTLAAYGVRRLS